MADDDEPAAVGPIVGQRRHRRATAGPIGRPDRRRWRIAAPADAGGRGLDRERVDQIVHRILAVALDPTERDTVRPGGPCVHEVHQRLPEVAVGDRLLLRVQPTPLLPALPPAIPEAVDDIGRVADDVERPGDLGDRLRHCGDLHALIRRVRLGPAGEGAVGHGPCPPSGTGVPEAGTVRVGDRRHP